jgi:ribosome-binding factor A
MSYRTEQIAEVIQRQLNNFLIKEAEPPRELLITITGAEVVKDLSHAFIEVSVLPVDKTGTALEFLKKNLAAAGRYISKYSTLRRVPKLMLKVDDSALKHRRVERALED